MNSGTIVSAGGEAVLPTGEIVHLGGSALDSPGLDLVGALVGSEGTLAVVTKVTLRIVRVPESVKTILAAFESTEAAGVAVSEIIGAGIIPAAVEMMDRLTIEAAEAGQDGNRFSVVAAEMKNLADQAKECTVHVRKILGEIQKAINTSVMLTEEAVKRVESGKRQADVSENVIRQISSTTEESIQAFQQIIGATNQQQVGLEQVARGMQDIDQAAQQTATVDGLHGGIVAHHREDHFRPARHLGQLGRGLDPEFRSQARRDGGVGVQDHREFEPALFQPPGHVGAHFA